MTVALWGTMHGPSLFCAIRCHCVSRPKPQIVSSPTIHYQKATSVVIINVKLLTTAELVDNFAEKFNECPLNRGR